MKGPALILCAFLGACTSGPRFETVSFRTRLAYVGGGLIDREVTFELVRVAEYPPFKIGRREVTWDEFEAFQFDPQSEHDGATWPSLPYVPPEQGFGRGRQPVINIQRTSAEGYCAWLARKTGRKFRLPTEEEWERACRMGRPGPDCSWSRETSGGRPNETGTRPADALGLFDMLGNVWEYCQGEYSIERPVAILRGGSWMEGAAELTPALRRPYLEEWNICASRPKGRWWLRETPFTGFRVACDD